MQKLASKSDILTYSMRKISKEFNIPKTTLFWRAKQLGLDIDANAKYDLTADEVDKLINYNQHNNLTVEVIYVTRETEVLHSKLNYLTLKQLDKLCKLNPNHNPMLKRK